MSERIHFVDKSFDINEIHNYHLSLQVNLKGFSFSVLNRTRNRFIALGHYVFTRVQSYKVLLEELNYIFSQSEVLRNDYQHIKLIFATPKFTFIPSAFYSPEAEKEMFSFNHELSRNEELLRNYVYGNSSYVVYSMPSFIKEWFLAKFSQIKIYHQSCPMIEELILKNKLHDNSQRIYINVYAGFYDLSYIKDGELQLHNTFSYNTPTDWIYFLLNIYERLKLSPHNIPLYISGMIDKGDYKIEKARRFIKNIEFFNKPEHFEYSFGFNTVPDHYFTNLINLYQCG